MSLDIKVGSFYKRDDGEIAIIVLMLPESLYMYQNGARYMDHELHYYDINGDPIFKGFMSRGRLLEEVAEADIHDDEFLAKARRLFAGRDEDKLPIGWSEQMNEIAYRDLLAKKAADAKVWRRRYKNVLWFSSGYLTALGLILFTTKKR